MGDEELQAASAVMASGWVAGQGPSSRSFEERFAARCDTSHAIAVNNATAGLHLALLAHGVSAGDEVIVADYTYPATGHAVVFCGGTPVFCDVRPDTANIDVECAESLVTDRTVGVIAVDVAGQAADYDALRSFTSRHGLFLIQDAACSAGGSHRGRPTGSPELADVGVFSLHGRKGITCGEGGVITTADDELAAKMRKLSCFGVESALSRQDSTGLPIPVFDEVGFNYKLSDIACAIAGAQLDRLDDLVGARRRIAAVYDAAFADDERVQAPFCDPLVTHTYQAYILTLDPSVDRDAVAVQLRSVGVGANIGTFASHLQPVYESPNRCPVSADVFARHLTIPMHANLDDDDLEVVIDEVRNAVNAHCA